MYIIMVTCACACATHLYLLNVLNAHIMATIQVNLCAWKSLLSHVFSAMVYVCQLCVPCGCLVMWQYKLLRVID